MSLVLRYALTISRTGDSGSLLSAVLPPILPTSDLPVTVSNDVFGGSLILDAEITVTMSEGATADTFEAVLTNLPGDLVTLIRSTVVSQPLSVTIHLGYFDDPSTSSGAPVMDGRVTAVESWIGDDGLSRIKLTGQEEGGYRLRSPAQVDRAAATTADDLVRAITQAAGVGLADQSAVSAPLENFTIRNPTGLDALRTLADLGRAPLVVRDRSVYLGPAVGAASDPAPVAFDPEVNLVTRGDGQGEDTQRAVAPGETGDPPPIRNVLKLTVLGHPGLRVGQVAQVVNVDDVPPGPLRIADLVHRYGSRGYTCEVTLVAARAGEQVTVSSGVRVVADRIQDVTRHGREANPSLDVGEVTGYNNGAGGKHLVSLHYGQNPPPGAAAPSVEAAVDTTVGLHDKPVASPFAFGGCGLVTPVYPGMRALLAHNRGLVNDAVVIGHLWPQQPGARVPANQDGDWWLALPTQLGPDGQPTGKTANDLTDAGGYRVIQARGLHMIVGTAALPSVGTRPSPPADDSVTIEHSSKTKITIDAQGAVTISTSGKALQFTNGSVTLTIDGSSVTVS